MGSLGSECDVESGQCRCLDGVGGPRCDGCLVGYWGFSPAGCTSIKKTNLRLLYCTTCDQMRALFLTECDVCTKEGHICDQDTGRCVCPPHTQGHSCQVCALGAWGYDSYKGCKVTSKTLFKLRVDTMLVMFCMYLGHPVVPLPQDRIGERAVRHG